MKGSRRTTPAKPRTPSASRKSIKAGKARRSKRLSSTYALIGAAASLVAVGTAGYVYYNWTGSGSTLGSAVDSTSQVHLGVHILEDPVVGAGYFGDAVFVTVFLKDKETRDLIKKKLERIPEIELIDLNDTWAYGDIHKTGADFAILVSRGRIGGPEDIPSPNDPKDQLSITRVYELIRHKIPGVRVRQSMVDTLTDKYNYDVKETVEHTSRIIGEFWKVFSYETTVHKSPGVPDPQGPGTDL